MRPCLLAILAAGLSAQLTQRPFANFETPQTRPVAIAADGLRLYALNTPDSRLAVFSLQQPHRPTLLCEIPVGLEPVAVRVRNANEVWVVNRLSDSVSIVSPTRGVVLASLAVGDAPADVVFAGTPEVALVSVAGARAVLVFDAQTRVPLAAIPVDVEEPRALAASADGRTVWLAAHRSGNQTTVIPQELAPPPPPPTNPALPPPPQTSLIVDATDPQWTAVHRRVLPDHDVLEIDVQARAVVRQFARAGTTLFNLTVHPTTGDLWVANTDARNRVRFEPSVRGHVVDHRLTQIVRGPVPRIVAHDLNPGIDYRVLPNPAALARALAQPTDVVFTRDGSAGFVAAFGSDRVGIVDASGSVTGFVELGVAGARVEPRRKRGPRGLALHPVAPLLYVANRLAMTLSVVDTQARTLLAELPLGDPTPPALARARGFLYDSKLSGNGTASCAACHVDGDTDGLAWDLGDPGGQTRKFRNGIFVYEAHPMKGPLLTQTLFGLTPDAAPFHWRGEQERLQDFNAAFATLLGGARLPAADMDDYAAFLTTLQFAPNPEQNLDRTLSTTPPGVSAHDGFVFFTTRFFAPALQCVLCHTLPTGSNGLLVTGGFAQEPQDFENAPLRSVYRKLGRAPSPHGTSRSGFGLFHDGSVDSVFDLLGKSFHALPQASDRRMLEAYLRAFDTGTAPSVGYGVTVTVQNVNDAVVGRALALLEQQAQVGNCDLVARGLLAGEAHGFVRVFPGANFVADATALGTFSLAQLRGAIAAGAGPLTFLGVPIGAGWRTGIDRDGYGVPDGDEMPVRSGPATPACAPPMRVRANSLPHTSNRLFALVVDNAPPAAPGAIMLGPQAARFPYFDLVVLVDPATALVLPLQADALGTATLPLVLQTSAVGTTFYAQAVFPVACGTIGLGLSDSLRIAIGR